MGDYITKKPKWITKKEKKSDWITKKKDKDTNISERVGLGEKGLPKELVEDKEVWMMGDEVYETTEEDRKRMRKEPEDIGLFGGGRTMRYFNEGGGVYGYFHGGGVDKNQGQYDIQVKKIKGKGKVL